MGKIILGKEDFEKKELAKQKGGLYEYYEYGEGNKKIVIRFYGATGALAVDQYQGIDIEDSESAENVVEGTEWEVALVIANKFFNQYEYTGKQEE